MQNSLLLNELELQGHSENFQEMSYGRWGQER